MIPTLRMSSRLAIADHDRDANCRNVRPMLTFSGVTLDRAGTERLDPEWVAVHLGDPASRVLVGSADGVLVSSDPSVSLLRLPVPARAGRPAEEVWPVMLGLEDGAALFALDLVNQPPEERRRLS